MSRVAVVTGGMGGLGEAICMKLGKMGYKVVATYSPGNTKHNEWLAEMKKQGYEFRAEPVDVTNFESCQQAIAQIAKDVGPVDVLVNNAGITRDTTFRKMDQEAWHAVINTNLDNYNNGKGGLAPDAPAAAKLYELAANQGIADAAFALGRLHETGEGVARDLAAAERLYRAAAAAGLLHARKALARLGLSEE